MIKASTGIPDTLIVIHIRGVVTIAMDHFKPQDKIFKILKNTLCLYMYAVFNASKLLFLTN